MTMTTNATQDSLLEEIFIPPSNEIIKDRFSAKTEDDVAADCTGRNCCVGSCRGCD